MSQTISATEANRRFSELLRQVCEGESFTVTSHGRPVAKLVPVEQPDREKAKAALLARLKSQPARNLGPWTREELYEP